MATPRDAAIAAIASKASTSVIVKSSIHSIGSSRHPASRAYSVRALGIHQAGGRSGARYQCMYCIYHRQVLQPVTEATAPITLWDSENGGVDSIAVASRASRHGVRDDPA